MSTEAPRLLVVDDEPVVAESCLRIFGDLGYQVEAICDSREGLHRAESCAFDAILLDFKMPQMDGLEFLEQLRQRDADVPVIMITGYSSVPSAAAAMRMGACDYISKPFTPSEIRDAVSRVIDPSPRGETIRVAEADLKREVEEKTAVQVVQPEMEVTEETKTWAPTRDLIRFLGSAWLRTGQDATVRIGGFLPREEGRSFESVRLPRVGDHLRRGLPMAVFSRGGSVVARIPAPLSGRVVEINHQLAERPNDVWESPCRDAWVARIRPSALEQDLADAQSHIAILAVNGDAKSTGMVEPLQELGCTVKSVRTLDEMIAAMETHAGAVLLVDAKSYGNFGPVAVRTALRRFPDARVVICADSENRWEQEYRQHRILYYAVAPFSDGEIIDILAAAFSTPPDAAPDRRPLPHLSNVISGIQIRNHSGERISMIIPGELIHYHRGLGRQLLHRLTQACYPIQSTVGARHDLANLALREIAECDRLFVLLAEDVDLVPGQFLLNPDTDLARVVDPHRTKLIPITVQPEVPGALSFDLATECSLADHLAHLMTSER